MFDRPLTVEELANVIENIEHHRIKKWMSLSEFLNKVESITKQAYTDVLDKNHHNLSTEEVAIIAKALDCSLEDLLVQPAKDVLSTNTRNFIKEAIKNDFNGLYKIARDTKIPLERLNMVIIREISKFNQYEFGVLLQKNFSFPDLVPFVDSEVNFIETANQSIKIFEPEERKWYDQRRAISLLVSDKTKDLLSKETNISIQELNEKILLQGHDFSPVNFAPPPEKEWQAVLKALGAETLLEAHLILMGRYSLIWHEAKELIQCENIFQEFAKQFTTDETIKNITEETLYHFYLNIKQAYGDAELGKINKNTILNLIKDTGRKKFIFVTSAIFTSALKSIPVVAAEVGAEVIKDRLDKNSIIASEENRIMAAFVNRFGSHLIKFLLLIPKALDGAFNTSILKNNSVASLLTLPKRTLDNFFIAEGYSASIVQDWQDLLVGIVNEIKSSEMTEKWRNTCTAELFKDSNLLTNPNIIMPNNGNVFDGFTPLHAAAYFGEDLMSQFLF